MLLHSFPTRRSSDLAAFAIMLATKNERTKGLAGTSGLSAWLGVTEPAMFGVNLRFKYPFIAAVIGSSIAGALLTMQNVNTRAVGVGGVPGVLSSIPRGGLAFRVGLSINVDVRLIVTHAIAP